MFHAAPRRWCGALAWAVLAAVAVGQTGGEELQWQVRGRVVDASGSPLSNAGIAIGREFEVTTDDALERPAARTDREGRFALEFASPQPKNLGARPGVLIAAPDQTSVFFSNWAPWENEELGREVDLGHVVLIAGTTLRGRVRDESGAPLQGVRVSATDVLGDRQELPANSHGTLRQFGVTTTDARGIFTLRGVPATGLMVACGKPGYFERVCKPVSRATPLDITMSKSGFCRGQVVDEKGEGIETTLTVAYEVSVSGRSQVDTDAEGHFSLPLAQPTRYRLVNYPRPGTDTPKIQSSILEGPIEGLLLQPTDSDKGQTVSVRAFDAASGDPLDRFDVVRTTTGPGLGGSHPTHALLMAGGSWVSGRDGVADLLVATAEDARQGILVSAPGRAMVLAELQRGDEGWLGADVRLEPGGQITGKVVDAKTGKGISKATVVALAPFEEKGFMVWGAQPQLAPRTDRDGRFSVDGLSAGRYALYVAVPGRASTHRFDAVVREDKSEDVELRVVAPGRLSGLIEAPVPAGSVAHLRLPRQRPMPTGVQLGGFDGHRAGIGESGVFEIEGIDPGAYELDLILPQRSRIGGVRRVELGAVTIDGDRKGTWAPDLAMARIGGNVTIDSHPDDIDRLVVFAEAPQLDHGGRGGMIMVRGGPRGGAAVGLDGRFEFSVPPGSYELAVHDMGSGVQLLRTSPTKAVAGEVTTLDLTVPARRVKLRLQPGKGVACVLSDNLEIQPAADDLQRWLNANWWMQRGVELEPDQSACWFLAPAGRYTISVSNRSGFLTPGPTHSWTTLGSREIEVGDKDVEFAIEVAAPPTTEELGRGR